MYGDFGAVMKRRRTGRWFFSDKRSFDVETCCTPKSLFLTSIPMMLSILSGAMMQMVDQYFLAHFSESALPSATLAQQIYSTFMLPCLSFAAMSEVFVGQFNGAKLFRRTSTPILQIVLLLIAIELVWVPIFLRTSHFFIPEDLYGEVYPYTLIGFAIIPVQIFHSALSAFFVGTQRARVVLPSVIAANVLNCILDPLLIFGSQPLGLGGWIPSLGAAGAAWATLACTILCACILAGVYFGKRNALHYDTRRFHLDRALLKRQITLSAPYAASLFVEMANWVYIANQLAETSFSELQLNTLCLNLWRFLFFLVEGLQKGVTATASNLIGAGRDDKIPTIMCSMKKIAAWVFVLSSLPFVVFAKPLFTVIFDAPFIYELPHAAEVLIIQWISFAVLIFTLAGLIGVLSSGGDTLFVTSMRLIGCVCCIIIPVQIISYYSHFKTWQSWGLGLVNMIVVGCLNYRRYKSGNWQHKVIERRNHGSGEEISEEEARAVMDQALR